MNTAGKKVITDTTVETFCNQKALNEQSQTENPCWRSILFCSVCLFRVNLDVGVLSPYSTVESCQLFCRIFLPRRGFRTVNEKFKEKFAPWCFNLFFFSI